MKKRQPEQAFALVITLMIMALIFAIALGYLMTSRSDREASALFSSRLEAQTFADSGLTAAVEFLRANTKDGNYITAMPAPSPSPAPHATELYRASDPDTALTVENAVGTILASQVAPNATAQPTPQIDSIRSATPIPAPAAGEWFGLPATASATAFDASNSFNFNEIIRIAGKSDGRLVHPDGEPAYGQWIKMRDSTGALVGRFAFFIEDESMKLNVDYAGNTMGGSNTHLRFDDLTLPLPNPTPVRQIQELNPSALLPAGAERVEALQNLVATGDPGERLPTATTLALVEKWNSLKDSVPGNDFAQYGNGVTIFSKDDNTTARGWKRLNLNQVVAEAEIAGTIEAKAGAARRIADWIKEAWTGSTPIASLQSFQMFNDERIRLQLAASIVDYIDTDSIPTDLGNYPESDPNGYPILGIEKIPYLVEVDVIYSSATTAPGQAAISMKFRFNFQNLFGGEPSSNDLPLGSHVGSIKITGVPVIIKNGVAVFDHEDEVYEVSIDGPNPSLTSENVSWGGDNVAGGIAGVKTFRTPNILTESVTYEPGGDPTRFEAGAMSVEVLGKNGERLDVTKIALNDRQAKAANSGSASANDFLERGLSAASQNATYEAVVTSSGSVSPISFGDPRYRPAVITKRWYNLTRTDEARFGTTSENRADLDSRAYSIDWYDYIGNRPLSFLRNGPMLNIGELGHIATSEYPWRSLYFQYAGRSNNTNETDVIEDIQKRRGSFPAAATDPSLLPQDYVLTDLFTTSSATTRPGVLNVNTQIAAPTLPHPSSTPAPEGPVAALLFGLPVGGLTLTADTAIYALVRALSDRRIAVSPATPGSPPIDNSSRRPYFKFGEVASDISWKINQSENSTTSGGGRSRTTVVYSVLRSTPTTKSQWTRSYGSDMQVEQPFRKISDSITTRGNVFRVLYVGQALKDINKNGEYDGPAERRAEILGEAFIEREATFEESATSTGFGMMAEKTTGSSYRILTNRLILE